MFFICVGGPANAPRMRLCRRCSASSGLYKSLLSVSFMPYVPVTRLDNDNGKSVDVKDGGVCIYCGSDGGASGLRREHVVPFSLGGRYVLQKASCRACEDVTKKLDGYLANVIFRHFRVHNK